MSSLLLPQVPKLDDVRRLRMKCIIYFSRSQFKTIIKLKLVIAYLVSVRIFLPLYQFELAPIALAQNFLSRYKRWEIEVISRAGGPYREKLCPRSWMYAARSVHSRLRAKFFSIGTDQGREITYLFFWILLRGPDRKKPDRLAANQSARSARIPDRKKINSSFVFMRNKAFSLQVCPVIFKLAPSSGTGLLQLLRVLPSVSTIYQVSIGFIWLN